MSDLIIHRSYCEEHAARDHWLDESGHCHGKDLVQVQRCGYTYARHVGGGWFAYRERYQSPVDLAWEMTADAHSQIVEVDVDF